MKEPKNIRIILVPVGQLERRDSERKKHYEDFGGETNKYWLGYVKLS